MASFKERIAKLRAANAAKLAEAEAEKDQPKTKKRCLRRPETANPTTPLLSAEEVGPDSAVLGCIAGVLDWKARVKRVVRELSSGLLCTNHLVTVQGEGTLVLRHSRPELAELREAWGQPLAKEYAFASAVGRNSLGPTCTHFLEATGTIVSRHLPEWSPLDKKKAREHYRLVMQMMNKLHALPTTELLASSSDVAEPFNAFQQCEGFLAGCHARSVSLPDDVDDLYTALRRWQELVITRPQPPECAFVVCHNDLRGENILCLQPKRPDEEMQLRMIDFEHAALGDRYFDLASFSRLNGFEDEEDVLLLKIYFGRFNDKQMVRLQLMKAVADLHEAMRLMLAVPYYIRHPPADLPAVPLDLRPPGQPLFPAGVDEPATDAASEPDAAPTFCFTEPPPPAASDAFSPLPAALAARAQHCFAAFRTKALAPQFTEYFAAGL
eukprot:GGOE01037503.1.p1 GENE.GGOE01037503.1~~GGOE01037503.1.p1  ORF type:complete len:439 (+),score=125.56 GGOE01037503.1:61-1377(+)